MLIIERQSVSSQNDCLQMRKHGHVFGKCSGSQLAAPGSVSTSPEDHRGTWGLTRSAACLLLQLHCVFSPLPGSSRSPRCTRDQRDEGPQGKRFPWIFYVSPLSAVGRGIWWSSLGCKDEHWLWQHLLSCVSAVLKGH